MRVKLESEDTSEICALFACLCRCLKPKPIPVVKVSLGDLSITFHGDFSMQVPDTGGPFTADITGFVDAKGNPVVDTDVPVWASSDALIATVVVSDSNPDEATVTLTGALGQAQITATFGDTSAGGFVVTGSLEVQPTAAVSATMTFSGTGIGP